MDKTKAKRKIEEDSIYAPLKTPTLGRGHMKNGNSCATNLGNWEKIFPMPYLKLFLVKCATNGAERVIIPVKKELSINFIEIEKG